MKKTIDTDWLRKELTDRVMNGEISSETMKVFFQILAKWEKENADS